MSYEIKLRFRRFGYGTGHPTGLSMYYIELSLPKAPGGPATARPCDLDNLAELLGPATISACTFTVDLGAIICFMADRLARGPDADVRVPSVGSPKYPSRRVDVIYS